MYDLIRYLVDDVLMGPTLAPFTVFAMVVLITLSVAGTVAAGRDAVEEED